MEGESARAQAVIDPGQRGVALSPSTPTRALTVRGIDVPIPARDDETLLATIYRAGYAVRAGCHRGGCGICTVEVVTGDVEYPVAVCEQALPAQRRAEGVALACRAVPVGDVTIAVPPESRLRCIAPLLTRLVLGDEVEGGRRPPRKAAGLVPSRGTQANDTQSNAIPRRHWKE
ncbi:2Fe-2S iron-sulfur cluster-binding protein [Xylanimonas ulmi]|uniref:Ferredoxin n=1 Tax=Xylanimonas ulmi TaxID=228973 RepID=A0A4Q7M206_9MICO|nr:2Fe-2S iron-sulfur cluster binding domain-containing protein [Xylanibacterium ulmi]RZS61464.1 ferredoxin [Xylanibacterium ulmi]